MASRLVNLVVRNVAAVERPANRRKWLVIKREDGVQTKKSALSFNDAMMRRRMSKVHMALGEHYGALMETLNSIGSDEEGGDKTPAMKQAMMDFADTVKAKMPHMIATMMDEEEDADADADAGADAGADADAGAGVDADRKEHLGIEKKGRKISAGRMAKLKLLHKTLGEIISEQEDKMEKKAPDATALTKIGHAIAAMFGRAAGADDATIEALEKAAGAEPEPIPDAVQMRLTKADEETALLRKSNNELKVRLDKAEANTKKAADEAAKLREEQELRKFAEEIHGYRDVGLDPAKDAVLLKNVEEKVGKDAADRLREVFRAQMAQKNASGLMREIGSSGATGGAPDSAVAEVALKLGEMIQKNDKLDRAAAMDQVFTQNPGLYDRYRRETLVKV